MPSTDHRRPRRRIRFLGAATTALALATAGLTLLVGGAHAAATNLIVNGGFETGSLAPWTCTANSGSVVTSPVHSGSRALAATPVGNDDAQCSQTVQVLPNTKYALSGFVQGNYVYLGVTGSGADTSTWTSSSAYQQLSAGFTTGTSVSSVTIWVHGWYGRGTYHADDIALLGRFGAGTGTGTYGVPEMVGTNQTGPGDFGYWVTRTQSYLAHPTPLP